MEHLSLAAFLEGEISPVRFSQEVADEVSACEQSNQSQKSGRIVITDGPEVRVTRVHVRRLLQAVIDGQMTLEVANYTASCIIFGDFEFADEAVNEVVWLIEMADLDKPTIKELRAAIARLV